MSQLKGSGGKPKAPPSPVNTPDNLRSADTVEVILGVSEGPIKGLTNGHKSFYVGDTVLQRQDGDYNFKDFDLKLYPGDTNPEMLKYRLGGEASNNQVGVSLAYGIPVTRQTQHGNIDAIDIRLVVSALYKQVQEGKNPGVFDHTFNFAIRFKPVSATTWGDWYDAGNIMSPNNPHVSEWDSSWSPESYQDSEGRWFDPTAPKQWFEGTWLQSVLWYRDQLANQPGGPPPYGSLTIRGKTTSTYVKEFRIPVQRIPEPYQIQIQRLTPDSSLGGDPQYIAEVAWESFQTIDTTPKFYPNTAITQIVAKSTDQFSSIPQMWGIYDGLIVRVPSNYNPQTREYTGTWNGTWKNAWTNNPVWLLYEAIHNTSWGWSAYTEVKWSKYEAYDLAQICDFTLPNGKPRYTFNAYITDPMDGREFCRYVAGSFNSVIVDDQNGNVQVLMDKDDPAVAIVGPESVVGNIEYSYTDVNTRFNDMTVVFANPEIDYNEDRRRLHNQEHMDQHGRIPYDFVAVGCTDENEAVRKASRRMVSALTETEMVTFKTTRIASYWKPYDIILITDPTKGYGLSGRFKSWTGTTVTLRDPIYLESGINYGIDIQGHSGIVSRNIVTGATGWTTTLTLASPLDSSLVGQKAQFSLKEGGGGYGLPKPYRILNITENDGNPDDFDVFAIEVNRLKFAAEDNAEIVGEPIYSFPKSKEPEAPQDLVVTNASRSAPDGTMIYAARIDFRKPSDPYITGFFVRYRQVGEVEYVVQEIDGSGFVLDLPREGSWEIQVQTRNIWNQQSPWVSPSTTSILIGKQKAISGGSIVKAEGFLNQIKVEVEFPQDQPDIRYAVVFGNQVNSNASAAELGKIDSTKFEHTGLAGVQTWYYWVKFEDNLGNRGGFTASAGVGATTKQATGADIEDGAISPDKFEVGFDPIQSVNSLPSPGGYPGQTVFLLTDNTLYRWDGDSWEPLTGNLAEASGIEVVSSLPTGLGPSDQGRVVFLKADNKIYRWTGTAWIASTNATDIVGQIVEAQIANGALIASKFPSNVRPVEVLGTLPTTGNTVGRQAYLTTDGKLYRWNGSAWTAAVASSDMVGQLVSSQIADGAITIGKLTSGLTGIESVSVLPSTGNFRGRTVMLQSDGKLYRWNSTATTGTSNWTAAVSSVDISGQLTSDQIASVVASKVSGQLTSDQIASVVASKISGQITATQISDNAVSTPKLAANAITADKITSNAITAVKIAAGAVETDKLAANAVTADKITSNAITAVKIAAGAVETDKLAANAVTADKIAANSITAVKIAGGSITGDRLAAGTIQSAQIGAGSIVASKLAVTSSNINPDPGYNDMEFWQWDGDHTNWYPEDSFPIHGIFEKGFALWDGFTAGATDRKNRYSKWLPKGAVKQGSVLKTRAKILNQTNRGVYASFEFYDSSYSFIGSVYAYAPPGTPATNYVSPEVTVPPNAVNFRMVILAQEGAPFSGVAVVGAINVVEVATGELIVDGAITADKLSANSVTATKIAAGAVTADKLSANSVTAGAIQAGAIAADKIAANAIVASKMVIGDTSNMVDNGFSSGDRSAWLGANQNYYIDSLFGWVGQSNARDQMISKRFPVKPGDKIYFEAVTYNASAASTGHNIWVYTYTNMTTGGIVQPEWVPGSYTNVKNSWTKISGIYTVPPNIYAIAMVCQSDQGAGQGTGYWAAPVARRAMSGELIVDGAIYANHLTANSVTANALAANSVTADALAANSVVAGKISVSSLAAINANLGDITAGNINMTYGTRRIRMSPGFGTTGNLLFWAGPTSVALGNETIDNGILGISATDGFFGGKTLSGPFDSGTSGATPVFLNTNWTTIASTGLHTMRNGAFSIKATMEAQADAANTQGPQIPSITYRVVSVDASGGDVVVLHQNTVTAPSSWGTLNIGYLSPALGQRTGNRRLLLQVLIGEPTYFAQVRYVRMNGLYTADVTSV